jgi:ribonuclease HI
VNIITINTDASFSQYHNRGSYAFWIASDEGKFLKSGMLNNKVVDATMSEMMCIYNAFYFIKKFGIHRGCNKIIVNTDSMNSIHFFKNDVKAIKRYGLYSKQHKEISNKLLSYIKDNFSKIDIDFRHVKAHEHTNSARNLVNDWCDKECKKHMGEFLDKIKIKNIKNAKNGQKKGIVSDDKFKKESAV